MADRNAVFDADKRLLVVQRTGTALSCPKKPSYFIAGYWYHVPDQNQESESTIPSVPIPRSFSAVYISVWLGDEGIEVPTARRH